MVVNFMKENLPYIINTQEGGVKIPNEFCTIVAVFPFFFSFFRTKISPHLSYVGGWGGG
jgi:hypothetical protein